MPGLFNILYFLVFQETSEYNFSEVLDNYKKIKLCKYFFKTLSLYQTCAHLYDSDYQTFDFFFNQMVIDYIEEIKEHSKQNLNQLIAQ